MKAEGSVNAWYENCGSCNIYAQLVSTSYGNPLIVSTLAFSPRMLYVEKHVPNPKLFFRGHTYDYSAT